MTARAPNWFEQKYIKGVTHILQDEGWHLRTAVNQTGEIKGSKVVWKIAGKGEATERKPGGGVVPVMNADRQTISADIRDYEANDFIETTDIEKMSENEQQVAQKSAAMAFGRLFDRIVVQEMDTLAVSSATTIGDGSKAIDIVDVLNALDDIEDIGVGGYDYVCALPRKWMTQLELFPEFAHSDWVGDQYPLLRKAGARQYRGCLFIPMPSARFTAPAANQLDAYIWNKDVVGFVPNYQMRSRIDYVPMEKKYLAANDMGGAAKIILPEGVRRLRFASNVAVARVPQPTKTVA